MKWFLVKYIYQIVSGTGNYDVQFDEQLRLMLAGDKNEALCKAEAIADNFHPPFKNCKGELVTWKFICVADLHEIQAPGDGAEVTSILHEPDDVSAFLKAVEKREAYVKEKVH